jgi:dGTPase
MNTRLISPHEGYAPFACRPEESRGRLHAEQESTTRSCFQRDRDRIIHSSVFRRLMHKTQVFVYHEGDYFRTRLTHSLEVAQIARSLARALRLDEDLAEALALAHDLGHPPFGHAGEDVLQDCMANYGGFDHNAYALRHVTELEQRYADFNGLNLSWETLEGIVKHNGPLVSASSDIALPAAITDFNSKWDLGLNTFASAEAQVAALSDDIAYNNHDLDDGLRAGLFSYADIEGLPLIAELAQEVKGKYPALRGKRLRHETIRRLITFMINDLLTETSARIGVQDLQSADDVRGLNQPLVAFSSELKAADKELRKFLFENMYRHYRVNRSISKAKRVVSDLFELFLNEPEVLPPDWQTACEGPRSELTARVVCDYIAGMTDRYALLEHKRLFQIDPLV